MHQIVVPTDFSACAMSALKVAAKISDRIGGATISLVHTYEVPVYGFTSGQLMYDGKELTRIKKGIEDELHKIAALDFVKKHKVERLLLPEYAVDDIVDHDHLKSADLIVMGTHGTSGWKEELIGSNTEKIIRRAKCPVLAVREDTGDNFNPDNVVFASSFFGEVYDRFPKILDFAKAFNTRIHLLRVNTPNDFMTTILSEKLMKDFSDQFKLTDSTINIFNDVTVEDGVMHFAERSGADLIAMETHGRTGISHLINGSIAEDVANHANLPILTFRIKQSPKPQGVIFPESKVFPESR